MRINAISFFLSIIVVGFLCHSPAQAQTCARTGSLGVGQLLSLTMRGDVISGIEGFDLAIRYAYTTDTSSFSVASNGFEPMDGVVQAFAVDLFGAINTTADQISFDRVRATIQGYELQDAAQGEPWTFSRIELVTDAQPIIGLQAELNDAATLRFSKGLRAQMLLNPELANASAPTIESQRMAAEMFEQQLVAGTPFTLRFQRMPGGVEVRLPTDQFTHENNLEQILTVARSLLDAYEAGNCVLTR